MIAARHIPVFVMVIKREVSGGMIPHGVAADAATRRARRPIHAARRRGLLAVCGWVLCAVTFAIGCGQRTNRYPVEGVLTIDGKPVPQGLQVVFTPEEPQAVPEELRAEAYRAVTNDSGRYVAYFRPGMKGLPAGRYVVSIVSPDEAEAGTMVVPPWLAGIKIPERYRVGRSTLTCDVRSGGTVFNLDVQTH